jgi:TRAP-type C4-dicarboxylate transport system permease large subunit
LTAAGNTAMITFIIASAGLYGWLLARGRPQLMTDLFLSISREPWAILLMVNSAFSGCLMEQPPSVILTPADGLTKVDRSCISGWC